MKTLKPITKFLPCKLTDQELLDYGAELGSTIQDISAEEARQTSMKTELKARMTALEAKSAELSTKITRQEELRDVKVEPRLDFKAGIYREVRTDTGEVIRERPITDDERQEELEIDKEK